MQFPPSKILQTVSPPFWAYSTKNLKRSRQTVFHRSQVGRGIELWNRDTRCRCRFWCQCHFTWIETWLRSLSLRVVWNSSQLSGERRGGRRLNARRGDTAVGDLRGLHDGLPWRSISGLLRQVRDRMAQNDTCGWDWLGLTPNMLIIIKYQKYRISIVFFQMLSNWIKKDQWSHLSCFDSWFSASQLVSWTRSMWLTGCRAGSTARKWLTDVHLGSFGELETTLVAGGVLRVSRSSKMRNALLLFPAMSCMSHQTWYWSCQSKKGQCWTNFSMEPEWDHSEMI